MSKRDVIFNNGLQKIGTRLFNCTALKSIIIPPTVIEIGEAHLLVHARN